MSETLFRLALTGIGDGTIKPSNACLHARAVLEQARHASTTANPTLKERARHLRLRIGGLIVTGMHDRAEDLIIAELRDEASDDVSGEPTPFQKLATAVLKVAQNLGIAHKDAAPNGPELLMLLENIQETVRDRMQYDKLRTAVLTAAQSLGVAGESEVASRTDPRRVLFFLSRILNTAESQQNIGQVATQRKLTPHERCIACGHELEEFKGLLHCMNINCRRA